MSLLLNKAWRKRRRVASHRLSRRTRGDGDGDGGGGGGGGGVGRKRRREVSCIIQRKLRPPWDSSRRDVASMHPGCGVTALCPLVRVTNSLPPSSLFLPLPYSLAPRPLSPSCSFFGIFTEPLTSNNFLRYSWNFAGATRES